MCGGWWSGGRVSEWEAENEDTLRMMVVEREGLTLCTDEGRRREGLVLLLVLVFVPVMVKVVWL